MLLAEADRILVMRAGAVVAERAAGKTDEPELIRLAAGTASGARDEPPRRCAQ